MHNDIKKIIQDGVQAPSGENAQPWKFRVNGNSIIVINIPERDQSLYNSKQKGSYVAHGALIENIVISARVHGYISTVELFPNKENDTHVATILLQQAAKQEDSLYGSIQKRCTNRKSFSGKKLTDDQKNELTHSVLSAGSRLVLVDDNQVLSSLGEALALNEHILFENKKIHDFFYDHIIWDKKDEGKAGGFFIDTLEFLPHQLSAVKLFKSWKILSLLNNVISVARKISQENGEKYASSGTLGAIIMAANTKEDWVNVGRSVQRMWLTATKLGLSVHPCNGTIYFMEQINDGGVSNFSEKHSTLITQAYKTITKSFGASTGTSGVVFRIGYADPPTARALRLVPEIES